MAVLDAQLEAEIPAFSTIFKAERYDEYLKEEQEKERLEKERKKLELSSEEDEESVCYNIALPYDQQKKEEDIPLEPSQIDSDESPLDETLSEHDEEIDKVVINDAS